MFTNLSPTQSKYLKVFAVLLLIGIIALIIVLSVKKSSESDNLGTNRPLSLNSNTKKIFFIRGWNTTNATYESIKKKYPNYSFYFFDYNPSESLDIVYPRLKNQLASNPYDIIMCHSMGGYLCSKLIQENLIDKNTKVILLMPLEYPYNFLPGIINKLDLSPNNYKDNLVKTFPLGWISPPSSLTSKTTIRQDALTSNFYKQIPIIQILQAYKNMNYEQFLNNIKNYPNLYFIYALEEKLNTLPPEERVNLRKILGNRYIEVPGLHEVFNDYPSKAQPFFNSLSNILSS
jgi:hypothetical protein